MEHAKAFGASARASMQLARTRYAGGQSIPVFPVSGQSVQPRKERGQRGDDDDFAMETSEADLSALDTSTQTRASIA